MRQLRVPFLLLGVALFLLQLDPIYGQIGGSGTIQGVVSDPSGAVIPNATVTAANLTTGTNNVRQTTQAGYYVISPLAPGPYRVTVSAPGFQTLVQEGVTVDALSSVGLNLTLGMGSTSEQITVSAVAPPLNTSDASMGQTIRNDVYTSLPLAMTNAPRDPTAFMTLLPGMQGTGGNGNPNALGGQDYSTDIYVEGLPATNPVLEGEKRNLSLGVSVEAVDQFQVETAGTAVMYNGQGASNYVLKSGTNSFHGSVYEYFRNTALDAKPFFAKVRPVEHQNEFGFNISGPVKKDKVFFFGNYDGFRYVQGSQATIVTIPTLAERVGDFSAFPKPIYDPLTTSCNAQNVCTRTQFSYLGKLNIIPPDRISKISQKFQSFLPSPDADKLANIQSNYTGTVPVGYNNNSTTVKIDVHLTDKQQFFGLFTRGARHQSTQYRGGSTAAASLPLPYSDTRIVDEVPTTAQLKHTYVFRPNLLNQIALGFSRLWVPITNATLAGNYPNSAGLTGLPHGEADQAFPEISWSGPNVPSGWRGTNSRAFTEALNTTTWQDNVQWIHGKHSLTFGLQIQFLAANEKTETYGNYATWNFSNNQTAGFDANGKLDQTTGNAYASFLLGGVNTNNIVDDAVIGTGGRYRDYSWWVQDGFKVTKRLTLNLGVRHDIWSPYVEQSNRMSFLNPIAPNPAAGGAPGILEFAGNGADSCHCRTPVETYLKNLGPRLGFAYSMTDKTVIRGGYSVMYTHRGGVGGRGGARTGTGILGYQALPSFTNSNNFDPAYYWNNGVPAYQHAPFFDPTFGTSFNGTKGAPTTLTYADPVLGGKPPRYQNWNFGFEHSVTSTLVVGAAYVGSNGHFLGGGGRGIWSDQINPKFLALGTVLLNSPATDANIAKANALIPGISRPYSNFSGTIGQMLRPFPQYNNISDIWGDVGNSNYNSLQITAIKRLSRGLTFNFNYTFSKALDDTNGGTAGQQTAPGGGRSAYNWKTEKSVWPENQRHVFNFIFVYAMPFGKGKAFGGANKLVDILAGGWSISGITTYRSGTPIGNIIASCDLPFAGGCYADYNPTFTEDPRLNGTYGSGEVGKTAYLDRNAFKDPLPNTYGNTPRTNAFGIHNPSTYNQDFSLKREFTIVEHVKFSLQVDALNAFNLVNFSAPSTDTRSKSFGTITSQANSPRVLQLAARITF